MGECFFLGPAHLGTQTKGRKMAVAVVAAVAVAENINIKTNTLK